MPTAVCDLLAGAGMLPVWRPRISRSHVISVDLGDLLCKEMVPVLAGLAMSAWLRP